MWSFFVAQPSSAWSGFLLWEKLWSWQLLYNGENEATIKPGCGPRVTDLGPGRCFGLVYGLLGRVCACMCASLSVCVTTCTRIFVCACVRICISLLGILSVLTRKLCLHFHFPSPAGPSPNLPWQLLSTRQAWWSPRPPPNPLSYAASLRPRCEPVSLLPLRCRQIAGDRCQGHCGSLFEDLCHRPALGPLCDLYCWKRLQERMGSVSGSELSPTAHCGSTSIRSSLQFLLSQGRKLQFPDD